MSAGIRPWTRTTSLSFAVSPLSLRSTTCHSHPGWHRATPFRGWVEMDDAHLLISTQSVSEDRVPFRSMQGGQKEMRGLDRRKTRHGCRE